ncbi:hypothetical protein MO973_32300 [Paenibacillus sp. TRM 82003]|nr:hypothetical protein [Paenibacillus sp. TRM 82003]
MIVRSADAARAHRPQPGRAGAGAQTGVLEGAHRVGGVSPVVARRSSATELEVPR